MRRRGSTTGSLPAFTLVEMLLALALTSVIGMAIVLVMGGVSTATAEQHDIRRSAIARQVAAMRLGAMFRSSCMVLGVASDRIVLWKGDETGNGKPDLSEIRLVRWDDEAEEIRASEAPADLAPSLDGMYELTDDFVGITALLEGSASFPERVMLTRVQEWNISLDAGAPQEAVLIRARLIMASGGGGAVETLVMAGCRGAH